MSARKVRLNKAYPTPPMNRSGKLVSTDKEKVDVLNSCFASVFSGSLSPHHS